MRCLRSVGIRSVALVLILAAVGAQAAVVGELTASGASFRAADVDGRGGLLVVGDDGQGTPLSMRLEAASIRGEQRELRTTQLEAGGELVFPLDDGERNDIPIDLGRSTFVDVNWQALHTMSMHLVDATVRAEFGAFDATAVDRAVACSGGIVRDADCAQRFEADDMYIETAPVSGPLVLSQTESRSFSLVIEGDLRLQAIGVDLEGNGVTLRSTFSQEDMVATVPGGSSVNESTTRILDLQLKDARIVLDGSGFEGRVDWAAHRTDVQPLGMVQFTGVFGRHQGTTYDGGALTVDSNGLIRMAAGESLQATIHSGSPSGLQGSAAGAVPDSVFGVALLILAAIGLAGGLGAGIWFLIRFRRLSMDDVEAALEAHQYLKAARLAGHLVRRRPDDDAPAIARAVALSKAGRDEAVIAHIEQRLGVHDPSDGVLHYILGLAQLALERRDEAFKNLKEAVRRTPSLEAEVSDRLGDAPSGSSPIYV